MSDLTVIILAQNEEKNIVRSVSSVKNIAKRIIVIDSGSEDRTVELAKDNGAEVFLHSPFVNQAPSSIGHWIILIFRQNGYCV